MGSKRLISLLLVTLLTLVLMAPAASAAYMTNGKDGLTDLQLLYISYGSSSSDHRTYSVDDLKKYVTHINRSTGQPDDLMFKQFLLLGIWTSSGRLIARASDPVKAGQKTDWDEYLNEFFLANSNLNALYTVAQYNGYQGTTLDVWIGYPYADPTSKFLGTTTQPFYCNNTERINQSKAWIDSFIAKWNQGTYGQRLVLRGFYPLQESVYYSGTSSSCGTGKSHDDAPLFTAVNDYVKTKTVDGRALKTLWIPYYQGSGTTSWSTYHFDNAFIQPHWYFREDGQAASISGADTAAETYGMGLHMEYDSNVIANSTKRANFQAYLDGGITYGYMSGTAHGWYDGYKGLLSLYNNNDSLYDSIYQFVKRTYSNKTVTGISVSPSSASITAGSGRQFTATASYSDGTSGSVSATWSSSNSSVATVSSAGYATGVAPGTATITASYSGYSSSASLTVTSSAGSGFDSAITLSGSTTGSVSQGQSIYYKFSATAGTSYTVTLTPSSGDPDLYVYNPSQTQIGSSTAGTGSTDTVTFTAGTTGNHYIRVYGYTASSYTLSVATTGGGCTDGSSFSCAISLGTSATGSVSQGGNVYYKFYANSGTSYTVQLTPSSGDPDLYVYNPSQSQIGSSTGGTGVTDSVTFTASTSGYYYVKVYGYSSASYTLSR